MTPSPDLLAVLREAREALESVSLALPVTQWARTIDAIGNTLARIDSALSAHEAQGWMPIAEAPKDGTFVVWMFDLPWPAYSHDGHVFSNAHGVLNEENSYGETNMVSYWMPLPPPPEPQQ